MMIKIYNEDCLDRMAKMDDESVDLVVTDPPYKIVSGAGKIDLGGCLSKSELKNKWINSKTGDNLVKSGSMFRHDELRFEDWLGEVYRVLKNGTHCYIMVNDRKLNNMINKAESVGFKLQNILFWSKGNKTPNKYYMKAGEFVVLFRKGNAKNINNMGSSTLLDFKNPVGKKTHPTEKPVDLLEHLILNSSSEGDLLFEPFAGTGSCCIAAKNTNRKIIATELDKEYFDIAKQKIGDK